MAPTPDRPGGAGTDTGEAKIAAAKATVTITLHHPELGDISRTMNPNAVPFSERLIVRKATGLAYENFLPQQEGEGIYPDAVQVLWWLGGRKTNPLLTLNQAIAEWPEVITADTFTVTQDDGEDDSPEA